jgi:hypothetical protein
MFDLLDAFANPRDEVRFLAALDRLAPATTTIVLGAPVAPRVAPNLARPVVNLDLDELSLAPLDRNGAHS